MSRLRKNLAFALIVAAVFSTLLLSCQQSLNVGGNKPSQPTNLVATAGDSKVTLTWDAATDASSYTVYFAAGSTVSVATNDGTKNAGSATTATVSGLTNGDIYAFGVTAVNENGTSALSGVRTATPNATVGKPTVSVTPIDLGLILTWAPVAGATSYNVYYKAGSSGVTTAPGGYDQKLTAVVTTDDGSGKRQYTLSSLTNGSPYSVVATSVNSGGESQPSTTVVASPGAGAVGLVPQNGAIQVSWTSASGATGYKIYWKAGTSVSKSSYDSFYSAPAAPLNYTIPGLSNWTKYAVVLTSISSGESGDGPVSTATPGSVPAAPASLAVVPHASQMDKLEVSYPASADAAAATAAGFTITYNVYWKAGASVSVGTADGSHKGLSALSDEISGLAAGSQYSVLVTASVSGFGEGAASAPQSATTGSLPGYPASVTMSITGAGAMDVSWTGISGATNYRLYYYDQGAATAATSIVPSITTSTYTGYFDMGTALTKSLSSLNHGHIYSALVVTTSSYGSGSPSPGAGKFLDRAPAFSGFTPSPANGSTPAVPASSTAPLSWSPATDPDGDAMTYDLYFWYTVAPGSPTQAGLASAAAVVDSHLYPNTYSWYVIAKDSYGSASPSSGTVTYNTLAPPGTPAAPTLTPSAATSMDVSWAAVSGSGTITYTVYYGIGSVSTGSPSASTTGTSTTLTGLTHGANYYIMVVASSAYGTSGSGPSASKLLDRAPVISSVSPSNGAVPSGSTAYPGSASFSLSWSVSDPDGDALSYSVYYGGTGAIPGSPTYTTSSSSQAVAAVANVATYNWRLVANDGKGMTADSGSLNFTTGQPPATAPTGDPAGTLAWKWHGSSTNDTGVAQIFCVHYSYDWVDPDNSTSGTDDLYITKSFAPGAAYQVGQGVDYFLSGTSITFDHVRKLYHCPVGTTTGITSAPPVGGFDSNYLSY
jgi:hypothetical protein